MKVEMRNVADIKPYHHNPRRNEHAVDAVAASLREFGFRQPLVLDPEGVIVVGDTRFKAALKIGLQEVPVHVAEGLTPAQLKAYRIADNKTGEIAEWDYQALVQELVDLQKMDFDTSLAGFSADELHNLIQTEVGDGLTDPDDIPEPPEKADTQAGELWQLGEHRLLCGDSARSEDVDRLLGGALLGATGDLADFDRRLRWAAFG
jgi:ParB-like chromosome segregation protein Spo0J